MMRTPLRILLVLTSQATMGDELLNREWFRSRAKVKILMDDWRQFYNERPLHSTHRYQPPTTIHRVQLTSVNIDMRLTTSYTIRLTSVLLSKQLIYSEKLIL